MGAARPGFHILVCPDGELIRRRIDKLTAEAGLEGCEKKVFWGDEELPGAFWQELGAVGLFGAPKAVVVRRAHKLLASDLKGLAQALAGGSDSILPFLCLEGPWERKGPKPPKAVTKTPFWKAADKRGWIWQSPGLTAKTMPEFVRNWAASAGLALDRDALGALAAALPPDARAAALELGKIELAASGGGRVTREHAALVAPHGEMDFFEFTDALAKGRTHQVWERVLANHAESDGMLFPLIGFMSREARVYWMLTHGEEGEVRMHPYAKKLKAEAAWKLGEAGVARLLDLCLDAEHAVKSGRMDESLALELFTAGLLSLHGAAPAGPGNPGGLSRHR